ncbi:MAG: hypothetical protein M0007_04530 [Actinomycetota bacterium]|jgi:hypothetical protein|nr:hypothetical protein [Actinomycetota bacterium]
MHDADTWSPDEPQGTETFEQADEAAAEQERLEPDFAEAVQLDPDLAPAEVVDELELEEIGMELDDPEMIASLSGGIDDPDGVGGPAAAPDADAEPAEPYGPEETPA